MVKFADFIMRNRFFILLINLAITLFFLYQIINPWGFFDSSEVLKLKVKTDFADLLPQNHEYIKVHNKIRNTFGGANQIIIMVQVRDGDIFNQKTLTKVKEISERLENFPAVDRYKIRSIAMSKMKFFKFTSGTMDISPLMFPEVPRNTEEMEELKRKIYSEPRYYGPYVSWDSKKTMIQVDFFEEELGEVGYAAVFEELQKLRSEMEDENHIINIAGEPMHLGYIKHHNGEVVNILLLTVGAVAFILFLFYRSIQGVIVPVVSGIVSGIWGLGIMALLGYHLDPLILVIPFLISMMTARHGMQKLVRYAEEYLKVGDGRTAARNVIVAMFAAGITGIITDSFGIALVAIAAIPILQKISLVCVLWTIPTLMIALIFTPLLLSYIPVSKRLLAQFARNKEKGVSESGFSDRVLTGVGTWMVGWGKWAIIAANILLVTVGYMSARNIEVGDFFPGSSILWPWHRYNKDAMRITTNMPLLNPLYVVIEGEAGGYVSEAETLREMNRFRRFMVKQKRVFFTSSIANSLPGFLMASNEDNPDWYHFPKEDNVLSFGYRHMVYSGEPGTWDRYVESRDMMSNIIIYCRDKMPRTIEGVIASVKEYIKNESRIKDGKYLLAGGAVGVQGGVREEIADAQLLNLTLALFGLFLFCAINFRSVAAGIILTLPLAISNIVTFALMAAYQVGLTVNTYPVSSIGIGLGVDYGIYFVSRLLEERGKAEDLNTAIINTVRSNGKAIIIIATTLTAGLLAWLFSPLKFQAEMGALLALVLFFNMLGALLLVPSVIAIFKPKFADRGK
jgi:predicted RND superfamily exporter protein